MLEQTALIIPDHVPDRIFLPRNDNVTLYSELNEYVWLLDIVYLLMRAEPTIGFLKS